MKIPRAVVVLSGGADSCICLYVAKKYHRDILAATFNYGQRHVIEVESAKKVAKMAGVEHRVIDLKLPELKSALLDKGSDLAAVTAANLPSSFVPGRNIFFLTAACAIAYEESIRHIYTGVCQTDYSGSITEEAHFKSSLNTKEALQ